MKKINVKTPAKINLLLEILGKRPDGFHELRSTMQAVSLYDCLTLSVGPGYNEINLAGNSSQIPYDETNLVYKAAELFLEKIGIKNQCIDIYIEKNIPVAAGLAGGSSDAAAVLRGLNEIYDNPLSSGDLHSIASQLGSDVNFCLEGGTCLAIGRGEKIERIAFQDLKFVLIKPKNLFISAKEAYQRYAELENRTGRCGEEYYNDLEQAIMPIYPQISEMKALLLNIGCKNALMSGSGPTVFGVHDGEVDTGGLPEEYEVFKVHSVKSVS